ncbi:MAG: CoA pyrophosphatase [Alphaproteobacteria bacterium]|nr:CoA pyrophosphatase [Alphaproteobacteria bacterium]
MTYSTREDFDRRVQGRLEPAHMRLERPLRSDFDLSPAPWLPPAAPYRPAAVLMGLVDRGDDYGVLLTLRPETMTRHAGQVAFPGGRIDPDDASPLQAALREAREEVGLSSDVEVLGQVDPYLTSSGFLVSVFLARLRPFEPRIDPSEVADVFETPLSFLMTPSNHQRHERTYNGVARAYYAMPHNGRYIWGATAGMIRSVYDRLYGEAGSG